MNTQKNILSIPLAVLLNLALSQKTISQAHANDTSIGVFPTTTTLRLRPGDVVSKELRVKNFGSETITLRPLLQPFLPAATERGEVSYIQTLPSFLQSIRVRLDGQPVSSFSLNSQEEKSLSIDIKDQPSDKAQDYYFSVVFLTEPAVTNNEQTGGVAATSSLSTGVASHFIVAINQTTTPHLKVAEYTTPFLTSEGRSFTVRATNDGDSFMKVGGSIQIENLFGVTQKKLPLQKQLVLARSTRSLLPEQEIQQLTLAPGIYRARLNLEGENVSNPISSSLYFISAPFALLTTILLLGISFYYLKRRFHKRISQ